MTEERDPQLQALFAEAKQELVDEEFTARVLTSTRRFQYRVFGAGAGLTALVLVLVAVFSAPLMTVSLLLSQVLSTELVVVGSSQLAWFLAPINNIGAAAVLLLKVLRMIMKKARSSSYAA